MENSRKCFTCQIEKPLSDFTPNRRKYQIKKYMGMLLNCDECILEKTKDQRSCVYFNFDTNKYNVGYDYSSIPSAGGALNRR